MLELKCEKCNRKNIIPESNAYFRLGPTGKEETGLLCWKCCKEISKGTSEHCKACHDRIFCCGKLKQEVDKWLKSLPERKK